MAILSNPANERVLVGSTGVISCGWRDQWGELTTATATPFVTVSDVLGNVVATGSATVPSTSGNFVNRYTFTLSSTVCNDLNYYTAQWFDTVTTVSTTVEVAGGYYASETEIRASDPAFSDASSSTGFTSAQVRRARESVERLFETYCGVAFVPRYAAERITGYGTVDLPLAWRFLRNVRSARMYIWAGQYYDIDAATLLNIPSSTDGVARRADMLPWWSEGYNLENIVVGYEHGYDKPPSDVVDAFFVALKTQLTTPAGRGVLPMQATGFSENGVTVMLTQPGMRGSVTGIPFVDAVLNRYRMQRPPIA